MISRHSLTVASLLAVAFMLGAWVPESSASLRCCYSGDSIELQAADVEVKLEDGRLVSFGELFPDFTPSTSFFTLFYPVFRLDIARVVYSDLALKFIEYDANDNGYIEEPELTVLFMQEAARGLNHPVAQLGSERQLRAIFVSAGDIDGLIRLVNRRRSEMKPATRKTFDHWKELIHLYLSLKIRSIHLRALNPFGFAMNTWKRIGYTMEEYLAFYKQCFDYIIELNKNGKRTRQGAAFKPMTVYRILQRGNGNGAS